MLRLTIVTETHAISLGLNGVLSLHEVMGSPEFDAIQSINDDFLNKLGRMRTHPFGFTESIKKSLLTLTKKAQGKKCLITNEWISKSNQARAQWYMDAVKLINQGFSLEDVQTEINSKLKHH